MIHNKKNILLMQFLGDYKKEVYGRELVNKVPVSQKAIALALDELEKEGILKARKQGNIKYFRLNLANTEIKDALTAAEIMKKIDFLKKQRKLAHIFKKDSRIVGVFGSYALGTQRPDSDVDIFIAGKKQKEDYDAKGKTLDLNISIKYFTDKEFKSLLKKHDNLCKEIIKNHIILFGVEKFVNAAWEEYYALD